MELSENAKCKRASDIEEIAEETDPLGYFAWILSGILLLVGQYMAKLTRNQRAWLVLLTLAAGGVVIGILLYNRFVGLALVLMFVLGLAVAEIRRL